MSVRALFMLLYNTGARVSEIVSLKHQDIDVINSFQVKIRGKGNKERIIQLFQETVDSIKLYMEWKQENAYLSDYLFLNKYHEKMTRQGVNYLVKKYWEIATEEMAVKPSKNITPHTFRHTTALHLLESENNIVTVKDWLGHKNINTTAQYVKIGIQQKTEAIDKINILKQQKIKTKAKWKQQDVMQLLQNMSSKKTVLC